MAGITAIYVDADTFTVTRDRTSDFIVGRRVKANCGADGYKYGTVESSSYSSPNTTVNLVSTNDDLTSNLAEVWYGSVKPGDEGNIAEHPHTGDEGDGYSIGRYSVDHNETDQGAAGNGNTIKAFVDAIGSDSATIYLRHNSGSATTTYTLTTNETIPSNITLEIERGAVIDGAGTLTINGSLKIGAYKVFGSSITIVYSGPVNPLQWGAVGDDATDSTVAFQSAIDAGSGAVILFPGTYRTTDTIVISTIGKQMFSLGGRDHVKIKGDHVLGPVLQIIVRQVILKHFMIDASTTRNAAAVDTDNYGLMIGGATAGSLTFGKYENLVINRQPSHSIYMGSYGPGTIFSQVGVQYGRGHGFMFDDGTLAGDTPSRNGQVKLLYCRSDENGGNAINLAQANQTCYRFEVENFECTNNAWNTDIASLIDAQIILRGENFKITLSAFGDAFYDRTTMPNGDDRYAKANEGNGIYIATASEHIELVNNRYINLTKSVDAQNGINGLIIHNSYNRPLQSVGFSIGTTCVGVDINVPNDTYFTTVLDSDTAGGKLKIGDLEYLIRADTAHWQLNGAFVSKTISSGVVNIEAAALNISGEGAAADTVANIRFAFGKYIPDGYVLRIVNENAYNITVDHGAGNLYTKTGANVVMGQNEGITFIGLNEKLYEI